MGLFKKIQQTVSNAGKQLQENVKDLPRQAELVGQIGAMPVTAAISSIGSTLTAAAPVLKQATGIIQANPLLANVAGTALGMPGLAGMFGSTPTAEQAGYAGLAYGPSGAVEAAPSSIPMWVWIVGGVVAVGAVLYLSRKR